MWRFYRGMESCVTRRLQRQSSHTLLFNWKLLLSDECFPHGEKIRIVDGEDVNRNPANSRLAGQSSSCPLEVFIPLVRPRMEESNQLARIRICSSDVRALVAIAMQTGKGEVFQNGLPPVLPCNDVIDWKGQRIGRDRKVAILTSVSGPAPDLSDHIPLHVRGSPPGFLLRASRAFDCMTARKFPICR